MGPSSAEFDAGTGGPEGYVDVGYDTYVPSGSPDGCEAPAYIHIRNGSAEVTGEIFDLGPRDFAAGTVGFDDDGNIVSTRSRQAMSRVWLAIGFVSTTA